MSNFWKNNNEQIETDVSASRERVDHGASKLDGRQRLANAASIDLDRIEADPQHREEFDEESLQRLSHSMRENGQLQPIRVRWEESRAKYIIIAGERRFRAAHLAEMTAVDCIIEERDLSENEILRAQVIENAVREDLKPTEQSKAFRDLMDREGWNGKQLAHHLGVNPSTVSRALKLLELPEEIQRKVDSGTMTAKDALKTLREEKPDTVKVKPAEKKKRGSKEGKLTTTAGTLTLKSRRVVTPDVWRTVLTEALEKLNDSPSLVPKREAA